MLVERGLRSTSHAEWFSECDCGEFVVVRANALKTAYTRSCGCLNKDTTIQRNKNRATHGRSHTPEFKAWGSMKERCLNRRSPSFAHYGGRGITICPEWLGADGFARFLDHVGLKPSPDHSIDRINNDGNYEPGNVRWATPSEQARNRRQRERDELGRFL